MSRPNHSRNTSANSATPPGVSGFDVNSMMATANASANAKIAGSRFESIDDVTSLPSIGIDTVLASLRERYLASRSYTHLSPQALISVNPYKSTPSDISSFERWKAEWFNFEDDEAGRSGKGGKTRLEPHVFGLAMGVYYHMKRTGQDQSIVTSGESGSGKSESRRLAIKMIVDLSVNAPGKKGGKLGDQIVNAEYIIESFGNALTHQNPNASRFGKYTELQFTDRGRLAGAKTLTYYLEKTRVAHPTSGERNFHVFYYLVAGASAQERQHLQLGDASNYRYLGSRFGYGGGGHLIKHPSGGPTVSPEDATRFEQLKIAFKMAGLSKRLVAQVCQLIAAILHLGNIDFIHDKGRNEEAATVRNLDVLHIVSEFLGIHTNALENVFSYRSKMIKKELCTVFCDIEAAEKNRDELAVTLYSLLFAWLGEHINQKLCKDDFASYICLLDLPGSQNVGGGSSSKSNSLDQFAVNYANEKLQAWTLKRVFEGRVDEMEKDGLGHLVPRIPFYDNSECVRLFDNQPGGLIDILDDQTRRAPKKTEISMVEAFAKRWNNHASFQIGGMDRTGFPTFTVQHYSGPVTYSSEAFLEKDADAINPDFVSLLRGHGGLAGAAQGRRGTNVAAGFDGTGSSNPFIQGLFTNRSVATQAHPQDDETIVAAQQSVKPLRKPSVRRKTVRRGGRLASVGEEGADQESSDDQDEPQAKGKRCVMGEFRSAMDMLFRAMDETQPWYIFCLNPNDTQLPNQVETRHLKFQIKSLGLAEIAKNWRNTYEVSFTHDEGCDRYAPLGLFDESHKHNGQPLEAMRDLARSMQWNEHDMAIGKSMVHLSHGAFHALENRLRLEEGPDDLGRPHSGMELMAIPAHSDDPFSPYRAHGTLSTPALGKYDSSPYGDNLSQAALPLVEHAQGFRDGPSDDDEGGGYDDRKMLNKEDRNTSRYGDSISNLGTEAYAPSRNMFQNLDKKDEDDYDNKGNLPAHPLAGETVEEVKESANRRRWVALCWVLTWWIPSFVLKWFGPLKRPDIRQAWREKLAINFIIWFICGCTVFVIAILGNLICPKEYVYSTGELSDHSYANQPNNAWVAIRGEIFDLSQLASTHLTAVPVVPIKSIMKYAGTQASNLFPVQVSALCDGVDGTVSPWVTLDSTNTSDSNMNYHDFRAFTNDSRPDWYFEQMVYMRWNTRVGFLGYTPKEIKSMAGAGRAVGIIDGLVYELTTYVSQGGGGLQGPNGYNVDPSTSRTFLADEIVSVFKTNSGQDITNLVVGLDSQIGADVVNRQRTCLRNLFIIGKVDNRNSVQCQFSKYILLALSVMMVSIIGFKFLAALHFGSARAPEDHDKFVICQVPCYTEGEDSLRKTIDSLARLKYDDKRKLLLVICDGNIVGSGNDRPTPRIVLDILGVDPNLEPEPLSFLSLGEGAKQHNMGKIYSGLYEYAGHVVPYVVIVKIGKPSERQRPGNRGKRDSQMLLMHFLNKVHFDSPMNPLELEMYHQIKNVIGVNPTFYEYIFMVDADTTVEELALNRLVSAMIHDKKIIGVCGETELANAKQSLVTMAQVYEYFISHHLAKAFESLFGSITCLPGCFTLYRLRTPDTMKPLFINNQVIEDYSENRVDTLHMKNLLHLGEDRYLTTLILKHFPTYKTKFVRDAHAFTVAPDEWRVLLSQRRRWINSTVHNLAELVFLDRLCGFCCFSMRFVVFIDLLSTIVAPVTVAYIGYLIYLVVADHATIPTLSIIMLAAIYGLQALIFIFRMRWDMVAWMIFYILAIPAFSFFLPLYSFWKMDDFSWGSTRLVMNESGQKIVIHDEGKFDPKSIPLKSWNEYENELWDNESNKSLGSWVPPAEKAPYVDSRSQSLYGRETIYDPYDGGRSREGITPAHSYLEGQSHSRSASRQGYPQSRHSHYVEGSVINGGHASAYEQAMRGSQHGGSQYGGAGDGFLHSAGQAPTESISRPTTLHQVQPTSFLPEYSPIAPLHLSAAEISESTLEEAIQRICATADLESLTKKGVRKQLEQQFGVSFNERKETINRLIERVLTSDL